MRAKKTGYKTGYSRYVEMYKAKEQKVGDKHVLSPMLSKEQYQLTLDEMKADALYDKKIGVLAESTSVNFNRLILNEAEYGSSLKQARAVRKGIIKFIKDNDIDISIKSIKLSDIRAKHITDEKLSGVMDNFWREVATAYASGMSSDDIGMRFFESE